MSIISFQFDGDGNDVDMPEGYPLAGDVSSDDESIMTLRFKGDDIGDIVEDYINAGTSINSNMALITVMSFIFSFIKMLF